MDNDSKKGQIVISQEGGYKLPENWRESTLPEELREDPTLKSVVDLPGMAKMLVHSQKMIGKDKIVVPDELATEEQWGEIFTKLGKPEKPDGYGLKLPENLPPGMEGSKDLLDGYLGIVHKAGLLPAQAKSLYDWYNEINVNSFTEQARVNQESLNTSLKALKKEWGGAFKQKTDLALTAVRTFADEDAQEALSKEIGNDPRMIKMFAAIGAAISEDKLKGEKPVFTPTEAQGEIDRIMADPKHPYHTAKMPGHAEAVKKVKSLYDALYGEAKEK